MKRTLIAVLAASAMSLLGISTASAQAIITSGSVQLGVDTLGDLGVSGIGITYTGVGDAITPGCLCEGWGVSGNGIAGWVGNANGGTVNVTGISFTSTASTATSVVRLTSLPALTISQAYAPSVNGDLFVNTVTITNTGATAISDLRYTRSMDWDIPPTTFSELVTIQRGGSTALLFSNDNGFATPNPLVNPTALLAGTTNVDFTDSGPSDHGAFFTFGFGSLAVGASQTFQIFYGASATESAALAALAAVGAEVYSFGQNNRTGTTTGAPATYTFAFSGVGGTPVGVPEPGTLGLLGLSGMLLGFMTRRRKALGA